MASNKETEIYPIIKIAYPKNPNRNWAFPILGLAAKAIILIPVFIEIGLLSVFDFFLIFINSFIVLFTGIYWDYCFKFNLNLMRLISKVTFFFAGLTDKYPGFDFQLSEFSTDITPPKNPSKILNFPFFGQLGRIILLIPFAIFASIINNAARIGVFVSTFPVFFRGKYPEGTYELIVDGARLGFSQLAFVAGIRDNYPSFQINMNHRTTKMILIILAAIMFISQAFKGPIHRKSTDQYINPNFQNNRPYIQPPKTQLN